MAEEPDHVVALDQPDERSSDQRGRRAPQEPRGDHVDVQDHPVPVEGHVRHRRVFVQLAVALPVALDQLADLPVRHRVGPRRSAEASLFLEQLDVEPEQLQRAHALDQLLLGHSFVRSRHNSQPARRSPYEGAEAGSMASTIRSGRPPLPLISRALKRIFLRPRAGRSTSISRPSW